MKEVNSPRTRKLTIIAQDPSVKDLNGNILKTRIDIPAEELMKGPRGYRVSVVDYDTSTGKFYRADTVYQTSDSGKYEDPFEREFDLHDDEKLLQDPRFHCQNVYAIIMRTLARFEFALGRRVSWGFYGHQIHVAPHAFADANAFYAERERALCFGYFRPDGAPKGYTVFTALSHDVVAHETTHALLDGLRERYTDPSSPDQAGFHEGFSDVVALLSVFSLPDVVNALLPQIEEMGKVEAGASAAAEPPPAGKKKKIKKADLQYITKKYLRKDLLARSVLLGLADEMGQELSRVRGQALRRSVMLKPRDPKRARVSYADDPDFQEPHDRGELLVAAVMHSFLDVWLQRIAKYTEQRAPDDKIDKSLIVDEGASAANNLLTMMIRALDYTPPTDLSFGDFLSAVLTSDAEVMPDDSRYHYREILLRNFLGYGIEPASSRDDGLWCKPDSSRINYERTHFESLLRDPTEVFRFIWDNRDNLFENGSKFEDAYTEVQSVLPSLRVTPDGFTVRETVATYVQMVNLQARELRDFEINIPDTMPDEMEIRLYGGGTLIFDEYGKLKYHIRNRIFNEVKQSDRLEYLWKTGYLSSSDYRQNVFTRMHLNKALGTPVNGEEQF